jgi:hypothetical protein
VDTGMRFVKHAIWTTPDLPFGCIKHFGDEPEISSLVFRSP